MQTISSREQAVGSEIKFNDSFNPKSKFNQETMNTLPEI